jgi:hypothetical protein
MRGASAEAINRIRSCPNGTAPEQNEKLGLTLMRLEERMDELNEHFGAGNKELGLDLSDLFEEL